MFGDHGLMLKGVMHYEGCIRVPMTVKGPQIDEARSNSLVSSLDLAQTILELTGLEEFDHMQGVSMVPVLSDPATSVRDQVFIEEDLPMNEHVARVPHKVRTLVTATHRTTLYSSGEKEVYNLTNDPGEFHNLAMLEPASEEVRQASDRLALAMLNATDLSRLNRQ
jgi:arylsulfatase A-like enzyme